MTEPVDHAYYKAKLLEKGQVIKDLRYLVRKLEGYIKAKDIEIDSLRQFPEDALREEAEKLLLRKKERVIPRYKDDSNDEQ